MNCEIGMGQISSFVRYFSSVCKGDKPSIPTVREVNRIPSHGVGISHMVAAAATTAALAAAAMGDEDDDE
jgi:hypothetical protein